MIPFSTSRTHRDHSIWTAVMGCTAWARRISEGDASESPRYFTFPSSTSFFISPTCFATSTSNTTRKLMVLSWHLGFENLPHRTKKRMRLTTHTSLYPTSSCSSTVASASNNTLPRMQHSTKYETLTVTSIGVLVSTRCW